MAYDYGTLLATRSDGILDLRLNRPRVRNAISHQMQSEIDLALDEAEVDPEVKAVMLRGEGAVFSAGHDLKEQATPGMSFPDRTFPHASPSIGPRLPRAWYFRKPLIAGVHGYVGPYAQAITACADFTIAAEGTRFSWLTPDVGWLPLYMILPMRVLEKMILMRGWMDAEQALQFQYVQRVVPVSEVEGETRRWAEQAAQIPTETFGHGKDQIRRSYELLGLANQPSAMPRYRPAIGDRHEEYERILREQGMTAALAYRDGNIDDDVARV
jgi:2-(1,2-epoxy-1,2-dihydrophenyl)acetyl-CoA isomerase